MCHVRGVIIDLRAHLLFIYKLSVLADSYLIKGRNKQERERSRERNYQLKRGKLLSEDGFKGAQESSTA